MPITALGFLAVFCVGCVITLKRPFIGLLLYFFVFYMHPPGKYWGSSIPELRWTLIVAVITIISTCIHEKNLTKWLKPIESKLLLGFFLYVCLQSLWVDVFSWHQIYVVLFFKLILLYFLILTLVNSEKRLLWIIITNLLGASYIGLTALQTHTTGRFEAAGLPSIADGNLLSIHMVPIVLLSSSILLMPVKKRFLALLPLALVADLIFLSGSRGGILGLLVGGIFFVWKSPKEIKGQVLRWSVVACCLGAMLVGPMLIARINQVLSAEDTESIDKSAYSRLVVIESQWEMFKDHAILGYGHRGTLILSPLYVAEEYMAKTQVGARRGSHNLTMAFLVDHGIIGSSLFFAFLLLAIKRVNLAKNNFKDLPIMSITLVAAGAGLVGALASSQFANSKVLEVSIWMVALIVCCSLLQKQNVESKTEVSEN